MRYSFISKDEAAHQQLNSNNHTIFPLNSTVFEHKTVAHHLAYTKRITKGESEKETNRKCHSPGFSGH